MHLEAIKEKQETVEDVENPGAPVSSVVAPSATPSLSKLFEMMKPEQLMIIIATLIMLAAEAATQIIPLIIANAYDVIVSTRSPEEKMPDIDYYMGISIIIFAAGSFGGFFRTAIFGVIGERLVARLRLQVYGSILDQEISFFDEHKSGELVSRLGNDTTLLQGVISQSLPEAFNNVIKAIVSVILTFYISPKLAGVSIGTILGIVLISAPLGILLSKLSKAYQDALGEAQTYSTEAIGSMRTVQSFTAEKKEKSRFSGHIGDPDMYPMWWPKDAKDAPTTYSAGFSKAIVNSGFFTIIFAGGFGFLYVVLWYGFYLVNRNEITLGQLTAFQSYVFNIGLGLGTASTHVAKIFEGFGASGRVFFLLQRTPLIPTPPKTDDEPEPLLKPKSLVGNIAFNDIKFAYPSRPDINVLNEFSLKIAPNTTTALVGSSGSGKSTILSLLQRFYEVEDGSISIDANNIKELDLNWLRQHIGYVQQEPQLFGVSIRDNLLYGVPDEKEITQEKLEQACRDANAHDFISSWTDGYNTLVGERGVKLSGGQKQRIAIARALVKECRILLLDEATSALDAESEHLVQEAIDKAVIGRSVIIVAHRLSTIQRAEQIVVMNDHKIVGVGTHDDLLKNCGKYQNLMKRQSMAASESVGNEA